MSSWHSSHRGRSIGRVLHFLYYYCGFGVAEKATVGQNKVVYHGKTIATYEFLSDTDIPYFTFLPNLSHSGSDMKAMYEQNQMEKVFEAIRDSGNAPIKSCDECRSLKLRLAMKEELCATYHAKKNTSTG